MGILKARKYKVIVLDFDTNGNTSFSKRMTQFIKDELETKNRIEYFKHNVQLEEKKEIKKEETKSERTFDASKFKELDSIKNDIKQQKADKEYSMLIESWQQIIDTYEESFENLKTIEPIFEAYINKAYYEGLDEMDDAVKEDIATAISIGRNFTFNKSDFAPRFLVKYERERERSKKNAKAIVTLNASDTHELIIDGISMGKAPVKVTELSYGKHFILVLDSNKIVKKKIVTLTKRHKEEIIDIETVKQEVTPKKEEVNAPKTNPQILSSIYDKLSKDEFNEDLKNNLNTFAKNIKTDFIVFGNSTKKHDLYITQIYLYNSETKTISFLTKAEFDTDLLTGDVEGLRVGNEIVKGIDNFSSLKVVSIKKKVVIKETKKKEATLRVVPFVNYKKLVFSNSVAKVENNKDTKKSGTVTVKNNEDTVDLDKVDTVKPDDDKKNINIANADYTKLDNTTDLDKYSEDKKDNNDSWYTQWWVWTAIGVVVIGAGAGTYYVLTKNNNSTSTTIPSGTW
jgi:hypothetical protein